MANKGSAVGNAAEKAFKESQLVDTSKDFPDRQPPYSKNGKDQSSG